MWSDVIALDELQQKKFRNFFIPKILQLCYLVHSEWCGVSYTGAFIVSALNIPVYALYNECFHLIMQYNRQYIYALTVTIDM